MSNRLESFSRFTVVHGANSFATEAKRIEPIEFSGTIYSNQLKKLMKSERKHHFYLQKYFSAVGSAEGAAFWELKVKRNVG
jgi:hypothetical protein